MAACGSTVSAKKDAKTQHIMLKKDEKDISRVQCSLQIKMPSSWNITVFVSRTTLDNLAQCNHLLISPACKVPHEEVEWGRFLRYLRDNDKVAIARSAPYCFYILPPHSGAILDCAKVAYVVEEEVETCGDQKLASSVVGESMDQPMSSSMPPKVSSHSSKVHRTHVTLSQKAVSLDNMRNTVVSPDSGWTEKDNALNPNLASVHPNFLENLGRAHDWIFGAIAELVDNSRDAKASRLAVYIRYLYSNKDGTEIPVLCVIDDGCGMNHEGIRKMVSLGHTIPDKDDFDRIGRFGSGFKTGVMRLGRDALVLTQTSESRSIAFLSQSLNEGKDKLEIPITSYKRYGSSMVLDTSIQNESLAKHNMKAIKEFSPFDKFLIGEKMAIFDSEGTGTQIYIWNLDRWGSSYTLEWLNGKLDKEVIHQGDIFTRHRQVRTRPGQISQKVLLDYSLQAYSEVIFLDPRMKIYVQGSKVHTRPLAKSLSKTVIENGVIMGKPIQLTLGCCQLEWDRANCGIFLYWHGRLIEAYKRVGVMFHSADMGRGVIGVVDVSTLMDGENGRVFVHCNKQGFLDCEPYSRLVEWLSSKVNAYCDKHVDPLHVKKNDALCKPDNEWVQCDKCRKWRMLTSGYNTSTLPREWFCYMDPFYGTCITPEQKLQQGVVTVSTKRSGYQCDPNSSSVNNGDHEGCPTYSSEVELKKEEEVKTPAKHWKRIRTGRKYHKK